MVPFKQIQIASTERSAQPRTAVFVGATSGIGLAAVEALLKSSKGSTVFIVGRSKLKFAETRSRLQQIDSKAKITFLEAQISLLSEVERVCATISRQVTSLDSLWLSQGGLGLRESHGVTSEGLPVDFAVSYYGRILFMHRLAPLLNNSSDGQVLSVLCAGMEGPINISDPGLRDEKNYAAAGFWGAQKQGVTMQSLAMRRLAEENPTISFIHTNPGVVGTDVHQKWSTSFTGVWTPVAWLIRLAMIPLIHLVAFTPERAGETGLFELMDEKFSSSSGTNFFRLDDCAEVLEGKEDDVLSRYGEDNTEEKIWEHTLGVFESVLAR